MYIEESFDSNFNMGYGKGIQRPSPWVMGRKNRPWTRGLKWERLFYDVSKNFDLEWVDIHR